MTNVKEGWCFADDWECRNIYADRNKYEPVRDGSIINYFKVIWSWKLKRVRVT